MANRQIPGAASLLLGDLLAAAPRPLTEVARTRMSVHYETGDASTPVVCVCTPDAVRLPGSLVTAELPGEAPVTIGARGLQQPDTTWRVTRWWRPERPVGLGRPTVELTGLLRWAGGLGVTPPGPSYDSLSPAALLGAGPGLTPAGDDVLAGALVTAHATGDPRWEVWRALTGALLSRERTTAVSRGMLHHAMDGYATPQLAAFLTSVCTDGDITSTLADLLAVGHSSGAATLAGVLHTLTTYELEGAA